MTPTEAFIFKKTELSTILKRWWQYEDEIIDFDVVLAELKSLVDQCPEDSSEQFRLELLEIENDLREYGLIE